MSSSPSTPKDMLASLLASFRVAPADPPVGSNRNLGRLIAHFLVIAVVPLMVIMVVGALLNSGVSTTSTAISIAWFFLVLPFSIFWGKLPEKIVRGLMLLALTLVQIRWTAGWLVLDTRDVFTSVLTGLIFTPLLLFIVALLEGRRNGVIIGLLVALNMGGAVVLGAFREELAPLALADPRLGFPTFVLMLVYAVIVNIWSSQQEELQDSELRAATLKQSANVDLETGLLNRPGLEMVATGWIHRGHPFALLLVQRDNMEELVASLGSEHRTLTQVEVGHRLSQAVGDGTTVARWSDDMFLLLSHRSDREGIERLAQRIRRGIFSSGHTEFTLNLSVSIGFTLVGAEEDFEQALIRADGALTEALGLGNCVRSRWIAE